MASNVDPQVAASIRRWQGGPHPGLPGLPEKCKIGLVCGASGLHLPLQSSVDLETARTSLDKQRSSWPA